MENENLSNENVIHIYSKNVEYIQFRKLLEYEHKVKHLYTLRPLDFGNNKNYEETKERILSEYKMICENLNLDEKNIYRPVQTHTDVVKKVDKEVAGIYKEYFKNVDGLVTNKHHKILSLTFADCIALYFFDPVKNVIGNIHSGWQGTYKEIARIAVRKMKEEYDVKPENLICFIGPSIKSVVLK